MRSSSTITLFAMPPTSPKSGSPAMVSIVGHVLACAWLLFGLRHTPQLIAGHSAQRVTVRVLNMPITEARMEEPAAPSAVAHFSPQSASSGLPSGGAPPSMPSVAAPLTQLVPKAQILVQPDAPLDMILLKPVPIPLVLKWTPPTTPTKTMAPATARKSILANIRPSMEPPNRELSPADFKMSPTLLASKLAALPASTTSPVVIRRPDPVRGIPETSLKQIEETNSAQVLSVSDLQAQPGPVLIPLANSAYRTPTSDSLGIGQTVTSAEAGHGNPNSRQSGTGPGQGLSAPDSKALTGSGSAHIGQSGGPSQGAQAGPTQETASRGGGQASGAGLETVNEASVTRVHLPRDGTFGVVVVGSSTADQYPESVGLWAGRLVYTVYLHVGPGKAWILQYSLPPAVQAASNGSNTRPEAPWPFDIVRPHLDPNDSTSDALMIHGFVNTAGRFERLAMVLPTGFAQAKFMLNVLQQWEFRPARQNGHVAAVEVLLIIPDSE